MSDLIHRGLLQKELSKLPSEMELINKSAVMQVINKQKRQKAKPDWIDASKQKPNLNDVVLAYTDYIRCPTDQHIIISRYENQDYWSDGTITHWMPLPEKPIYSNLDDALKAIIHEQ